MRRFLRDQSGGTLIESTLVFLLMMLLTWGAIEFGYVWWQWNGAEKATQVGARMAVMSSPIAGGLEDVDCDTDATTLGDLCSDPDAASFGVITCNLTDECTPFPEYIGFQLRELERLHLEMQRFYPQLELNQIEVEYRDVGLGFAGRPGGPVPLVTVRLVGEPNFEWIALGDLLDLNAVIRPSFAASLTGEDMNSGL